MKARARKGQMASIDGVPVMFVTIDAAVQLKGQLCDLQRQLYKLKQEMHTQDNDVRAMICEQMPTFDKAERTLRFPLVDKDCNDFEVLVDAALAETDTSKGNPT